MMFVVLLSGLLVLLALVVDVGAWLGTKRKLQSVADAAALSAAQTGQVAPTIDDGWAQLDVEADPATSPPDTVTVTATRDAPIIFSELGGVGGFKVQVTATAGAKSLARFGNEPLMSISPAPPASPYLIPIAVNKCIFDQTCSSGPTTACFDSTQGCPLNYDSNDPNGSLFGIANICSSGSSGCDPTDPANSQNFQNWVQCSPCEADAVAVGTSLPAMQKGVGDEAAPAVRSLVGKTIVVPVFDPAQSTYTVVGFAALQVTGIDNWQTENPNYPCVINNTHDCKVIRGYFTNYTLPSSFSASGTADRDYGVRAIGLTS